MPEYIALPDCAVPSCLPVTRDKLFPPTWFASLPYLILVVSILFVITSPELKAVLNGPKMFLLYKLGDDLSPLLCKLPNAFAKCLRYKARLPPPSVWPYTPDWIPFLPAPKYVGSNTSWFPQFTSNENKLVVPKYGSLRNDVLVVYILTSLKSFKTVKFYNF